MSGLIIVGLGVVTFGALVVSYDSRMKKRCTEKVKAKIVEIKVQGEKAINCYEYSFNGDNFKVFSKEQFPLKKFKRGQEVVILCNPKKPMEFYLDDEYRN